MNPPTNLVIPSVIEQTSRGERFFDPLRLRRGQRPLADGFAREPAHEDAFAALPAERVGGAVVLEREPMVVREAGAGRSSASRRCRGRRGL